MKKSLLVLAVAMFSTSAFAQVVSLGKEVSKEVTFIADMRQTSCQVEDKSVGWGPQETDINALRSAGGTVGKKAFSIVLTQCPGAYKVNGETFNNVSLAFDKNSGSITDEGTLKNLWKPSIAASENIQLQILENGLPLHLKNDDVQQSFVMKNTDGSHTFNFEAQLISKDGGATSGRFASSIPFSVVYK